MSQIELLINLLGIIIIGYLKPYNYMRIICIGLEHLMNKITNVK